MPKSNANLERIECAHDASASPKKTMGHSVASGWLASIKIGILLKQHTDVPGLVYEHKSP